MRAVLWLQGVKVTRVGAMEGGKVNSELQIHKSTYVRVFARRRPKDVSPVDVFPVVLVSHVLRVAMGPLLAPIHGKLRLAYKRRQFAAVLELSKHVAVLRRRITAQNVRAYSPPGGQREGRRVR